MMVLMSEPAYISYSSRFIMIQKNRTLEEGLHGNKKLEARLRLRRTPPQPQPQLGTMIYKSFIEMPVWQKAHRLAIEVFNLTINLPRSEDYGLTSQISKSSNA